MPKAIQMSMRLDIVERHQHGQSLDVIAAGLSLKTRTVRAIWRRYEERGPAGLAADYGRCGRQQGDFPVIVQEAACTLRHEYPDRGADWIHQQLKAQFPEESLPGCRSLQRWFKLDGCNRRQGRPSKQSSAADRSSEADLLGMK